MTQKSCTKFKAELCNFCHRSLREKEERAELCDDIRRIQSAKTNHLKPNQTHFRKDLTCLNVT